MPSLKRIGVLNRGEAATRCLRAIRELANETGLDLAGIAYYTDPDRTAPFVREADEAIHAGSSPARARGRTASRVPRSRARCSPRCVRRRADAVWPGWGFLAEDPAFVERLEDAGLIFLGPSAETMRMLGDKITSKRMAEAARVPVAAWSDGPVEVEQLTAVSKKIGFPLMIKATAGGGGRGIRMVERADELEALFQSAQTEAANAFGDGTLFLEACVKQARHVEVQLAADRHGEVLGARSSRLLRSAQAPKDRRGGPATRSVPGADAGDARRFGPLAERSQLPGRRDGRVPASPSDGGFFFLEVNPAAPG